MGEYEPQWSAEEQTMIDLMKLAGFGVVPNINREHTTIQLYTPDGNTTPLVFRDDTEYGAIRKVFKFVTDGKGSKYAEFI
jgi:hypothetical protein